MNIKRRRHRVYKKFLRRNMTSMVTKGYFTLGIDDTYRVQCGVNLNGINSGSILANPNQGVIMYSDSTGAIVDATNAGVSDPQQLVIAANNLMYERRRVAWVKMWFYPRYSEYPAMVVTDPEGDQQLTALENKVIYVCTDLSGLETDWYSMTKTDILANNTGVKTKLMNKPFKVFRRGVKYPAFPKYMANGAIPSEGADPQAPYQLVGGQWIDAGEIGVDTYKLGHIAIHAFMGSNSVFLPGTDLYEVKFEIKYVWADRQANNPQIG